MDGHWLCKRMNGHGGTSSHFFYGDHLLACVTPSYTVEGWLVGNGNVQDRWLMEAFVSCRAGIAQLVQPPRRSKDAKSQYTPPPVGFIGGLRACGSSLDRPYLADGNFNGRRWRDHWWSTYQAQVVTAPPYNEPHRWSRGWRSWLRRHRQPIETAFAHLDIVFQVKRLQAHSRWGQFTRLAAKGAAYNIGLFINQLLNRPLGALGTLIC